MSEPIGAWACPRCMFSTASRERERVHRAQHEAADRAALESPMVRPDVVQGLVALFQGHDEAERAKVRAWRGAAVEPEGSHEWWERVTVYAMAQATDAEVDAAMGAHEPVAFRE